MPGDRLPLAIGIRGEEDFRCIFGGGLQILDCGFLARDRDVFRLEGILDIDAERALRQIADVAHRRPDVVLPAEEAPKRFGLGRGFNDDQGVCHINLEDGA